MAKRPQRRRNANNRDNNHVARNTYVDHEGTPNPEIISRICELLREGMLLKNICSMPMMPSWHTVWKWLDADPDGFGASVERARQIGAEYRDEVIEEIADEEVYEAADVARNKLRVEVRERRNSRIHPSRFGERKALPPAAVPPKPGEEGEQDDAAAIASLNAIAGKIAQYATHQRGAPRLVNVTPTKKEAGKK